MTKTVTAIYQSWLAVENAYNDLIGKGIPGDNIVTYAANNQIDVTGPEESEPEIREILERHAPTSIS